MAVAALVSLSYIFFFITTSNLNDSDYYRIQNTEVPFVCLHINGL